MNLILPQQHHPISPIEQNLSQTLCSYISPRILEGPNVVLLFCLPVLSQENGILFLATIDLVGTYQVMSTAASEEKLSLGLLVATFKFSILRRRRCFNFWSLMCILVLLANRKD